MHGYILCGHLIKALFFILALLLVWNGIGDREVCDTVIIDIYGNSLDFPHIKAHFLNLANDEAGGSFDIIKSCLQEGRVLFQAAQP